MGWLDKYEDGGKFDGLTNKGFNYNGAWGGQFQKGGKVSESTAVKLPKLNSRELKNILADEKERFNYGDIKTPRAEANKLDKFLPDKNTREFFKKAKETLSPNEFMNLKRIQNQRGNPSVNVGTNKGLPFHAPKNYNPFTNEINIPTTKPFVDTVTGESYPNTEGEILSYIQEVSHAGQPISKVIPQFLANDIPAYIKEAITRNPEHSPYKTEGTVEHYTHDVVQPQLQEQFERRNERLSPSQINRPDFNVNEFKNGGWLDQYQDGGYLEALNPKLPSTHDPRDPDPEGRSSEIAASIGGEGGEPAYLIPTYKYGAPLFDPYQEYEKTGEHLGGPFKTWQEADKWDKEVRHKYIDKGMNVPTPIPYWGEGFAHGGSMPGSVGFSYARTGAPSNGPYAKKTLPSAQTGKGIKALLKNMPKPDRSYAAMRNQVEANSAKLLYSGEGEKQRKAEKQAILQDRKQRIAKANANPLNQGLGILNPKNWSRENLAEASGAIGDKMRFFPNETDSFVDEWLNPGVMIGGMASDLGAAPLADKQSNSVLPLAMAMGVPMLTGMLEGIGTGGSNRKFANNIINPFNVIPGYNSLERKGVSSIKQAYDLNKAKGLINTSDDVSRFVNIPNIPHRGVEDVMARSSMRNNPLSKDLEPYMSRYTKPISREEEIFQNYLGPEYRNRKLQENTVYFDNQGNVIANPNSVNVNTLRESGPMFPLNNRGMQDGGVIQDNDGYWNPDNWGSPVEIDSNDITMKGVDQPLLGISDTGDMKYMEPGEDYEFEGDKVTEYPIAQFGSILKSVTKKVKDIHKYNPYAFKVNPEKYYRVVGKDAAEDLASSKVVRTNAGRKPISLTKDIDLSQRSTAWPSFSKGKISTEYAKGLPEHYLIETERAMSPSTLGRHGKGTTQFPVDAEGKFLKEFPSSEAKVYKPHWLQGYKELPKGKNGKELTKLDQLTNFTNYNTKQPGGWLDRL